MQGYEGTTVYGCEIMWGAAKAVEVQELVEAATGQACPCKRRLLCPLLPAGGSVTTMVAARTQGVDVSAA